jgi:hypothetical protein
VKSIPQRDEAGPRPAGPGRDRPSAWQHIEQALRGLQFGSVTVIVQDGVVVQVERTERKRFS